MHPSSNQSNQPRPLTSREREVLRDIAAGLLTRQIAEKYGIAVNTVCVHRHNIIEKTGCANSTEAAVKYSKNLLPGN